MKVGLFQNPRTPGVYYAVAEDGRSLAFRNWRAQKRLAGLFGYQGPTDLESVIEWLSEKATVILPHKAEIEIEDPGFWEPREKI
jgi:hypothetical protein